MNKQFKDNRGISEIVVTVIMIVLAIVAIGLVWTVVSGLLKSGTGNVDYASKCMSTGVEIVSATKVSPTSYSVVIKRTGQGMSDKVYEKVYVRNDTGDTLPATTTPTTVEISSVLATQSVSITNIPTTYTVLKAIDVVPYFKDTSTGQDRMCEQQKATYSVA